ncbi:S26 family signal peptidase, partial [Clostridioides difficile]
MNETIKEEIVEWIKIIITALFFAFIITRFIKPTLVNGESMYPTLKSHD